MNPTPPRPSTPRSPPSFGAWFRLKDPQRDSLEPNPESPADVDLYIDLDGLIPQCLALLAARAPKVVLWGDYGTGKTHLLHVLQARIDRDRFEPVYLKLDAYGRLAESKHLHGNLLTALDVGGRLGVAIQHADLGAADTDLQNALKLLRERPDHPEARAWLLGRGPSPARAQKAGFSGPLHLHARGVTYSNIWRVLADGYRRGTDRELLFLIDETETFQQLVDQSRAADLGVAVREMVDAANKSYGVVFGLRAPNVRGSDFDAHPLGRQDVSTRLQGRLLELGGLNDPERRRVFISELLNRLAAQPGTIFTEVAIEALVEHGPSWARQVRLLKRAPVQREYVILLDQLAQRAFSEGIVPPIGVDRFLDADGKP